MNEEVIDLPAPLEPLVEYVMDGLVDYAGLFPPASCSLEETLNNYASFLKRKDSWILGRLIVPCGQLKAACELSKKLGAEPGDAAWIVSALVGEAGTAQFSKDLDVIHEINQLDGGLVIDAVECKTFNGESVDSALDELTEDIFPFFEIDLQRDNRGVLIALAGDSAGVKFRTGGVVPEAYPGPSSLAMVIKSSNDVGVPFKATAGLHHTFSGRNESVGVQEYGFFGVLLGALVARAGGNVAQIEKALWIKNSDEITFEVGGIKWEDFSFSVQDIVEIREVGFLSFGSCSFDEPCEDLRRIEWL